MGQCTGGGAKDGTYNVRTRYAYDDLGNVITVTAPNGRKTVTEPDADNRVSATVENWVDGVFSSASPTRTCAPRTPTMTPAAGPPSSRRRPMARARW